MRNTQPTYVVRIGLTELPNRLTESQALRYGKRNMPADLRRAGFVVSVFHTSAAIHGWNGIRLSYMGK